MLNSAKYVLSLNVDIKSFNTLTVFLNCNNESLLDQLQIVMPTIMLSLFTECCEDLVTIKNKSYYKKALVYLFMIRYLHKCLSESPKSNFVVEGDSLAHILSC